MKFDLKLKNLTFTVNFENRKLNTRKIFISVMHWAGTKVVNTKMNTTNIFSCKTIPNSSKCLFLLTPLDELFVGTKLSSFL